MKKHKKHITIDELLEKIPNKYELAIVSGKLARLEFNNGREKSKIIMFFSWVIWFNSGYFLIY